MAHKSTPIPNPQSSHLPWYTRAYRAARNWLYWKSFGEAHPSLIPPGQIAKLSRPNPDGPPISVLERVDREIFAVIYREAERVEQEVRRRADEPNDTVYSAPSASLFAQTIMGEKTGPAVQMLDTIGKAGYSRPIAATLRAGMSLQGRGETGLAAQGYITSLARRVVYNDESPHSEEVRQITEELFRAINSCYAQGNYEAAFQITNTLFKSWFRVVTEQPGRLLQAYLLVSSLNAPFLFSAHAALQGAVIRSNGAETEFATRRGVVESYLNAIYFASFAASRDTLSRSFIDSGRTAANNSLGHITNLFDALDYAALLSPVREKVRIVKLSYGSDTFSMDDIGTRALAEMQEILSIQEQLGLRNPFTRLNCEPPLSRVSVKRT